jgi:hypothetical protein
MWFEKPDFHNSGSMIPGSGVDPAAPPDSQKAYLRSMSCLPGIRSGQASFPRVDDLFL